MKSPFCTGFESTVGMSRRGFLNSFGMGLGGIALGSLLRPARCSVKRPGVA